MLQMTAIGRNAVEPFPQRLTIEFFGTLSPGGQVDIVQNVFRTMSIHAQRTDKAGQFRCNLLPNRRQQVPRWHWHTASIQSKGDRFGWRDGLAENVHGASSYYNAP